ncbi:hypothetical protein OAO19_03000 [Gammaproteobacteria bacterium]|nr:hypothetical protein [Gammaproteobacteria bacterium]
MFSWFGKLQATLVLVAGAVISALMLYISALKRDALQKELKQKKDTSERKDKAWESMNEGIAEENKPTKRGYFNDGDS